MCHSRSLFLPQSCSSWLWMRLEKNETLWQHPTQLGKLGAHSEALRSPGKENHGRRIPLLASSHATLRQVLGLGWGGDVGKVITSSGASEIVFFGLMVCWNFSGNQDFHRGSLIHGWLSKIGFSRGSETMTKRDQNQLTGHCRVHTRTVVSILIIRNTRGCVSLGICAVSHSSHRHFCPWMDAELLLRGDKNKRCLCRSWCWCHS